MADPQAVTATPAPAAKTSEFVRTLMEASDSMPDKPYMETRFLGAIFGDDMGSAAHVVSGTALATAVGAAEGIDIACGFEPKLALVANIDTFAGVLLKFGGMAGEYAVNLAGVPTITYADNLLKFGNRDGGGDYPTRYLHIDSAIVTNAENYVYLILG